MSTAIEHRVEIHRVQFPPGRNRRDIFVKTCNERDVPRARFSGHTCMRDPESAIIQDFGAEERCKMAGFEVLVELRVWVREFLECSIGS